MTSRSIRVDGGSAQTPTHKPEATCPQASCGHAVSCRSPNTGHSSHAQLSRLSMPWPCTTPRRCIYNVNGPALCNSPAHAPPLLSASSQTHALTSPCALKYPPVRGASCVARVARRAWRAWRAWRVVRGASSPPIRLPRRMSPRPLSTHTIALPSPIPIPAAPAVVVVVASGCCRGWLSNPSCRGLPPPSSTSRHAPEAPPGTRPRWSSRP